MKAKDTVMPLEYSVLDGLHCAGISDKTILCALNEQAEISFQAGIKEVVEWIRKYMPDEWSSVMDWSIWQAQLKEWGISEETKG